MGTRRQTHTSRPRGRRWIKGRNGDRTTLTLIHAFVGVMLVLLTLCSSVDAVSQGGQHRRRIASARSVTKGETILFDHSPSPVAHLERRQVESEKPSESTSLKRESFSSTASAAGKSATGTVVTPSDGSASTTSLAGSNPTAVIGVPPSDSTIPKPFDGGIGTNYTQPSCPTFLRSFLNNDTFTSCVPLSLLLQVSKINHPDSLVANTVRTLWLFLQRPNPRHM